MKRFAPLLLFLALHICTHSAEYTPAFPLWDNLESVESYAKRVNLPPTQTLDLGNGVKLELVLIPAGKFRMGTPEPLRFDSETYIRQGILGLTLLVLSVGSLFALLILTLIRARREKRRPQVSLGRLMWMTALAGGTVLSVMHGQHIAKAYEEAVAEHAATIARYEAAQPDEKTAHAVTLTKPFYMGKFTVTQQHYQAVMGTNPSVWVKGPNLPVEMVIWDDTKEFLTKVNEMTKQVVLLPTEAEWEYACRAGTTTTYYLGNAEADLERMAWYNGNSKNIPHPVGQKEPNGFGLYDMQGNVLQWCQDLYNEDYYPKSDAINPTGPPRGDFHSSRGSSWIHGRWDCRSAARRMGTPDLEIYTGFRIVLEPASKTP